MFPFTLLLQLRTHDALLLENEELLGSVYASRLQEFYVDYGTTNRRVPSLSELEELVIRRRLPWPVLNTTVYDDQPAHKFAEKDFSR